MTSGSDVEVPGQTRQMDAYLAEPDGPDQLRAGVIVVHEIFGLDDHIRDVCRRFADQGYVALAPNLFTGALAAVLTPANIPIALKALAEAPPGLRADPTKFRAFAESQPPERRPILEAFVTATQPATQEGYAYDLLEAAQYLRDRREVDPARIGAVGFCFGGAMVGRLATVDPDLRAAVIFYGQNPPRDGIPHVHASVLGLYGAEDPGITSTVPDLARAMEEHGKRFRSHVYPGAKHAFFNDRRPNYHAESAQDAWERVLRFFGEALAPSAAAEPADRR